VKTEENVNNDYIIDAWHVYAGNFRRRVRM